MQEKQKGSALRTEREKVLLRRGFHPKGRVVAWYLFSLLPLLRMLCGERREETYVS
jgi:hypothetical protein